MKNELYYGNIDPQARGYRPESPVMKVSDSLNALEEDLTEQLAGENKELFLRFCSACAEFMGECELDTFITGFRLGARFMMDTFLSDEAPFESFLRGRIMFMVRYDLQIAPGLCLIQKGNRLFACIGKKAETYRTDIDILPIM